ncbi:facilitated trehalose transporter Tret1-like [Chrysoperla carnea]|uniref:facilitated trehalose transporter Tret1-like n=1 Tax=Chrysoperla carnea TaxID=189513 RepID=UPI001D08844A|nr:facilitated trehalose transporter Tret1-like [Chrysoperla carnea]
MSGKVLHVENSRTALTVSASGTPNAKHYPQYTAAILATLSAFAAGSTLSWSSPALPLLESPDSLVHISKEQGTWISSIITLGACIGAIPAGLMVNGIGRRTSLQILGTGLLVSWFLIGYSTSFNVLFIGRALAGVCIGAISVAAPLYVSEIAEPRLRGTLGSLFQLQITLGVLFEYVIGAMLNDFLVLALITALGPLIFITTFSFMPESPVYLCSKGKERSARKALQWFRGERYDIEDEYTRMGDAIQEQKNNESSLSDIIQSRSLVRALIISLGLMFFQQMSGINAVIFYTSKIFYDAGSTIKPEFCSIIIGAFMMGATYVSTLLMDRAGRRILLLISGSIMSLCLGCLSAYFHFATKYDLREYSFIPLISVALFIVVFSLGFGPIPWLMMGEIFPSNVKGPASSLAASFNWITAFIVTKTFEPIVGTIGSFATFSIFTCVCIFGTIFVLVLVPETKGKSVEEIQAELSGEEENGKVEFILSLERGTKVSMNTNID